jgi:hypothetical protein
MTRSVLSAAIFSMVILASVSARADSGELLNFQGLSGLQPVGNFYNGGGLSSTPNYGITFSSNFYGLITSSNGGSGNFAPTPTGTHAIFISNGLTGATGVSTTGVMNVASGFSSGLNFFYTAGFASGQTETVTVWSGANGTGTVLATITLANNNSGCTGPLYCNWSDAGLSFSGTAQSVTFSGPGDELGLADITVGSSASAVPEPSTICLLSAGLVGVSLGQMRKFFRP